MGLFKYFDDEKALASERPSGVQNEADKASALNYREKGRVPEFTPRRR
jgi:hypothetical protein